MKYTLKLAALVATLSLMATATLAADTAASPAEQLRPAEVTAGSATPAAAPGATAATQPASQPGEAPKKQPSFLEGMGMPLVLLGAFALMYIFMGRNRKKQEQKQKDMLNSLKKGDRVVTIGGVLGTIIEAKPEEVVVKVDETNNVRMHFARWAIRGVGEEAKTENPEDKK
jgi:preprotein translocase subunit YajC